MHAPIESAQTDAAFVARVEKALMAAERDQASATLQFIEVGRWLLERKETGKRDGTIPHGQWQPWIEKNFPHRSYTRLSEYMRVAGEDDEDAKIRISELLPQGFDAVLNELRNLKRPIRLKPILLTCDVEEDRLRILIGDCRARLKELPDKSAHSCMT